MKYPQTKQRLLELLQAGHTVTAHWDCGGDESMVFISIDGQEVAPTTYQAGDFAYEVEQLLTEDLELPGVGEFSMSGDGQFFLEAGSVGIDYKSEAEVYGDELSDDFYDDFTDEQLAEMGLTRPAPAAAPQEPAAPPADDADVGYEEGLDAEASRSMSAAYTGRSILFAWPAA